MFEKFDRVHEEAKASIASFLNPSEEYLKPYAPFFQWLFETDINPYSFLPEVWADATFTATGMSSLFSMFHHAFVDDGDVTFVMVNGFPRIVFIDRWDVEADPRRVLSDSEIDMHKRLKSEPSAEVLNITPVEFASLIERLHTEWIKECFFNDSFGNVYWAAENYRKYKCWNEEWVQECLDSDASNNRQEILKRIAEGM